MKKFQATILVVDDEEKVVRSLEVALSEIAPVIGLTSPAKGLEAVRSCEVGLAIVDQRMPEMSGTELLTAIREHSPHTVRFLLTGFSDLEAMKRAINEAQVHLYIEKPWDLRRLTRDVVVGLNVYLDSVGQDEQLAHEQARSAGLEEENLRLRANIRTSGLAEEIHTSNPRMLRVLQRANSIGKVADVVLVCGETGTGKELVARRIHRVRHGPEAPFVAINCGALSEGLVESELFGHEKGSFTGAVRDFPGAFERARGGTVFLDEVGELKPDLQIKLGRVLEERRVRRVGGCREIPVTASILAATHRDLRKMVLEGRFREDLYYRLMVIKLELPPLRARREDIPLLANHFIERAQVLYNRPKFRFSSETMEFLACLTFRGNVRELRNLVRRAAVTADNDTVDPEDLARLVEETVLPDPGGPLGLADAPERAAESVLPNGPSENPAVHFDGRWLKDARNQARDRAVSMVDRAFVQYWFERCGGDFLRMARGSGLSRGYLYKLAKRSGFNIRGTESSG